MIPKSFKLFGETITVEMLDDLSEREDARGCYRGRENRILLQKSSNFRPKEQVGAAFCHELIHAILDKAGYDDLNDEKIVSMIGSLLHQALSTMQQFDDEEGNIEQ